MSAEERWTTRQVADYIGYAGLSDARKWCVRHQIPSIEHPDNAHMRLWPAELVREAKAQGSRQGKRTDLHGSEN